MTDTSRLERMVDEYEITRVRRLWAFSRDHNDWQALESCFHPDATVVISWFAGPAAGFVERSKQAAATRKPEERSSHWLGNARASVHRNRGLLETDVQILNRDYLDGHLFDCTCYGRFFDWLEKRDGVWRISRWTCVYDKDRLEPVLPGPIPPGFYDDLALAGPASSSAVIRLRQKKKGTTVPAGLIMGGSEDEQRLKREGAAWLAGG
jgi:hypothetical protein